MQKLYIMCGLAFSGKSTLARKIAVYTGSKLVAFDKLWVEKEKAQPISKDAVGWQFIRKVGQEEVAKALNQGLSVVYDDNNVRFEHREELRQIAKEFGAEDFVVYLKTPMSVILDREATNRITGQRHKVDPIDFQTVAEQLEPPTPEENVIEFVPEDTIDDWLSKKLALT